MPAGKGDPCAFPTKPPEGSIYFESILNEPSTPRVAPEPVSFDGYPDVDLPDGLHYFIPKKVREDPQLLNSWREDHNVESSEVPDELEYPRFVLNVDIAMSTGALRRWAHNANFSIKVPPIGMVFQAPQKLNDDEVKDFFQDHNVTLLFQ